jgi:hypothetical protein
MNEKDDADISPDSGSHFWWVYFPSIAYHQ